MTINDAADYLIYLSNQSGELPVTPLRLQKLLYLAQGWSFRWDGQALFPEEFEAWAYGPVNYDIYSRFREYGKKPISAVEGCISDNMDATERETLDAIWDKYRMCSTSRLVDITHNQTPWQRAYGSDRKISNDDIRKYYIVG